MKTAQFNGKWVYADQYDDYDIDNGYNSKEEVIEAAKAEFDGIADVKIARLEARKFDSSKIDFESIVMAIEDELHQAVNRQEDVVDAFVDVFDPLGSEVDVIRLKSRLMTMMSYLLQESKYSTYLAAVEEDEIHVDPDDEDDFVSDSDWLDEHFDDELDDPDVYEFDDYVATSRPVNMDAGKPLGGDPRFRKVYPKRVSR